MTKCWKLQHPSCCRLDWRISSSGIFLERNRWLTMKWRKAVLYASTVLTSYYFHWILQEGAKKKILLPLTRYNFPCNLFIFAVQFASEEKLAYTTTIFICPWIVNLWHMVVAWLQNQMRSPQKTAKVQLKQGELSASDEQTLIRHVQSRSAPHIAKGGGTCTS